MRTGKTRPNEVLPSIASPTIRASISTFILASIMALVMASVTVVPSVALAEETDGQVGTTQATGKEVGKAVNEEGTDASGKRGKERGKKETGRKAERNDGLGIVDAVILCLVIGASVAVIKSLAREGARRCAGNCAACREMCATGRNLAKDPELRERLRRLKEDGIGK